MPPTFRDAEPSDVRALVRLIRSAYRGEESRRGWTTEADLLEGRRTDADEVAAIIDSPAERMLLAEEDGALVGCCRLERRPDGSAYLGMLSVRPRLQDRGIGRAVVAEAERIARDEWSAPSIRMLVLRPRGELISWYERLGYRRTGEALPWPYDDPSADRPRRPDLDFLVLAKPLARPAGEA